MFWLCYGNYKGENLKHFINYVKASCSQYEDEFAYKVYVTDSLKWIFKVLGGEINTRYYDIISLKDAKEETRTEEEIITNIADKMKKILEV